MTKQVAEGCENRDLMDHMLFADSTLLYARNEMIVLRYQDCLSRLKANRNNPKKSFELKSFSLNIQKNGRRVTTIIKISLYVSNIFYFYI